MRHFRQVVARALSDCKITAFGALIKIQIEPLLGTAFSEQDALFYSAHREIYIGIILVFH